MMRRVYRPSRRHKKSGAFRQLVSTFFLIVLGAGGFYVGLSWFRSHTSVSADLVATTEAITENIAPSSVSAAALLSARANLVSAFDGQVTGAVNRAGGDKTLDYHVLVYLPGLDRTQETYGVWLLKDGLADVRRMGELSARADGSWVIDFTAGAISGIADPAAYRTLVIMKEPLGSTSPAGVKMAEAKF